MRRAHEGAGSDRAPRATADADRDPISPGHAAAPAPQPDAGVPATPRPPPLSAAHVRPKYYAWAALLGRTLSLDVLACPDCGGRLRFVATIEDRPVIEKILRHLGLPIDPPAPAPARQAEWLAGFQPAAEWLRN